MSSTVAASKYPVVIIGAGFCGLIALKICKENGLEAVVLEKSDDYGGLWRFRESDVDGRASVTRSTIINTSKEMSAMSDFPPPKALANYMHHSRLINYLEDYAEKFKLLSDVQFGHEVISVKKADNFAGTGEWMVHIKRRSDQEFFLEVRRASAVLVCIGHHTYPSVPNFPGQSDFRGKMIHTHSYKDPTGMEQKRILVVGVGNSGMDAAVETSLPASQVYLSTRRGAWILPRVWIQGRPLDFMTTRYSSLIYKYFPGYANNKMEKQLNSMFDHELYNLKPKHRYDGQHPTMSDALPSRIIGGAVIIKGDVHRFTEDGVIFKGEENQVYQLDAVIFATGYKYQFPFLEDDILEQDGNRFNLFRRMIPSKLAAIHPTLAIIGLAQPIGPIFPVFEMQARWMAKIISGQLKLPSEQAMLKETKQFEQNQRARFVDSQRHTVEVDLVPYLDMLAKDVGCKPNLVKLFFTDCALFRRVFFGPAVPYQYRLVGPHAWHGARDAILTVNDRMAAPFKTRLKSSEDQASSSAMAKSLSCGWLTCSLAIMVPCVVTICAFMLSNFA